MDTNASASDSQAPWAPDYASRPLERPRQGRMIAGVAAGIADYFDVETTIVRIALVVLTLVGGLGIPIYAAGWLLMPDSGCGWSVADDLLHHARSH